MYQKKTLFGYEIQVPAIFNKYEIIEYIGSGSFSVVYKVQNITTKNIYSAKIISMKDMENQDFNESIKNEINILNKIDHPNIIKLIDSFSIKNDQNEELFVILTEYCSNGNLYDYIKILGYINTEDIAIIIKGLSEALQYLHSIGIAHCDIKPHNILLDDNYIPKLCDFNLSIDTNINHVSTCGGSFPYSAPEVSEENSINLFKADIWSFAITIYEIAEGNLPFMKDENSEFITEKLIIETDDEDLKELVEKCTKINPQERINANQILSENYITKIQDDYYNEYDDADNDTYYNDDEYIYGMGKYNYKNHNYY